MKLTQAETEQLRALLDVAPELLEMGAFRRAEQASISASLQLGRDRDTETTRTLIFETPSVVVGGMFGAQKGLTVLREVGEWREVLDGVTDTMLDNAERAYLGGRIHEVTEDEARDLADAGYTVRVRVRESNGRTHHETWKPEDKEEASAVHI